MLLLFVWNELLNEWNSINSKQLLIVYIHLPRLEGRRGNKENEEGILAISNKDNSQKILKYNFLKLLYLTYQIIKSLESSNLNKSLKKCLVFEWFMCEMHQGLMYP